MLAWRNPQATLRTANRIAGDLLFSTDSVHEILLFGSVSRGQQRPGSDIDLIFVVPEYFYHLWLERVRVTYPTVCYKKGQNVKMTRLKAAAYALEVPHLAAGSGPTKVDIFLFPLDWEDRLDELQQSGGHSDELFIQNVCTDADRFDRRTNSFPKATALLEHREQEEWRNLAMSQGITVGDRGNGKS